MKKGSDYLIYLHTHNVISLWEKIDKTEISIRNAKFPNQVSSCYGIFQIRLIFNLIIVINSFFDFFQFLNQHYLYVLHYYSHTNYSPFLFISSAYCTLPYPLDARYVSYIFMAPITDDKRVPTHENTLWISGPYGPLTDLLVY